MMHVSPAGFADLHGHHFLQLGPPGKSKKNVLKFMNLAPQSFVDDVSVRASWI